MHTYILIFRCRWCVDAVLLIASVSLMWKSSRCPQSWINPEMYLCLRIIHIQMYDNDSQINPWQELPAVFWCTEGNLFFSCWPLLRPRPHFTANTLIDADTWAVFFPPSSLSSRNPVRHHTGNRCPFFVLVSTTSPWSKHKVFLLLQYCNMTLYKAQRKRTQKLNV